MALGARTNIEIDIMNTKHADGYRIVSEDEQALAFLADWIGFCQELEKRHGLAPRAHDWDAHPQRALPRPGRERQPLHPPRRRAPRLEALPQLGQRHRGRTSRRRPTRGRGPWGAPARSGPEPLPPATDTYCPAPHDQFVVQWNGDVVSCCTDYEGLTKTANVFATSVEEVWRGQTRRGRLKDMLEGRLLDVCARCQGLK